MYRFEPHNLRNQRSFTLYLRRRYNGNIGGSSLRLFIKSDFGSFLIIIIKTELFKVIGHSSSGSIIAVVNVKSLRDSNIFFLLENRTPFSATTTARILDAGRHVVGVHI